MARLTSVLQGEEQLRHCCLCARKGKAALSNDAKVSAFPDAVCAYHSPAPCLTRQHSVRS